MLEKNSKDGIVLTNEMMANLNKKLKPSELPDTCDIAETVANILEYMCQEDVIKIKKENQAAYEKTIENKFQDFANRYRGIFSLVVSGEDIDMLIKMLSSVEEIKSGKKDMKTVEDHLRNELAEEYILKNMSKKDQKKMKKNLGLK